MRRYQAMCAICIIVVIAFALFSSKSTIASSGNVVIAQVQAGASDGASREFTSIYNSGSEPVDVTSWCLVYNTSLSKLGCITSPDTQTAIWLKPSGFATFASTDFVAATSGFLPNAASAFTPGLSDTTGQLTLFDASKVVIDQVSWMKKPSVGNIYQQSSVVVPGGQPTTNNEPSGWGQTPLTLPPSGGLEEVVTPVYVCPNLGPHITSIPPGYMTDTAGNCFFDVCPNIPYLQIELPFGKEYDEHSNCIDHDECPNLSGIQSAVPSGFTKDQQGDCYLTIAPLKLTEVLPNVSGTDTGKEFIELYNPTDEAVSLQSYLLFAGLNYEKFYSFPSGSSIPARSYKVFSDTDLGLTLPNTSTKLKLSSIDGQIIDEMPAYDNPKDDITWALVDNIWQYTNRPTPESQNLPFLEEKYGIGGGDEGLVPCPAGKYRSVETNRCRTIEAEVGLTPCAADQIRNSETNRCRSIFSAGNSLAACQPGQTRNPETNRCRGSATTASANLTACSPGQERNPATNRCRKAGSDLGSNLKPCPAGQERNAQTNRCRKKASTEAAQDIQDIEAAQTASRSGWLLAGGALTVFGGYGVWEWRTEIVTTARKMKTLFGKNPPAD